MIREHTTAPGVDLDLPKHGPKPRALEPELEPADPAKE
jgi:hypothetical protein